MMGLIKGGLVAVALSLSFAAPAKAEPAENANAAYAGGDYATAPRFAGLLAEQGNVRAQLRLEFMVEHGLGAPQDHSEAVKWFRGASDQGFAPAQANLWMAYEKGHGVPQNDFEAMRWTHKAADQGFPPAQLILGFIFGVGQGVPQDLVEAYKWLNLAAAGASDTEVRWRAVTYRNFLEAKMTPAQIAEAQQRAAEWKPK